MSSINTSGPSVACSSCGYDLRGTVIGGTCPECGLAVNSSVHGFRVEGKYLVVRGDTILPARCINTNEVVDTKQIDKTLYWSHPALLLLILVNLLVFLIVVLVVRKKCKVTYFLSQSQKDRRRVKIASALLISLTALVGSVVLAMNEQLAFFLLGLVVFFVGLICAAIFSSTIRIAKMKDRDFWISGLCPEFLQSLTDEDVPVGTYRP